MRCPFCHHKELKVTDSRDASEFNAVRRRRECLKCFKRFTTFESIDLTVQVKKRDGTFEDFQQEKLIKGLDAACRHSRISRDMVRKMAYDISRELGEKQIQKIDAEELGEIVMKKLQEKDMIAYIRFACVYKRFKDIDDLMGAIHKITPKDAKEEQYVTKEK